MLDCVNLQFTWTAMCLVADRSNAAKSHSMSNLFVSDLLRVKLYWLNEASIILIKYCVSVPLRN